MPSLSSGGYNRPETMRLLCSCCRRHRTAVCLASCQVFAEDAKLPDKPEQEKQLEFIERQLEHLIDELK
jgi:hypothetical protein